MGSLLKRFELSTLHAVIFDQSPGPILILDDNLHLVQINRCTVEVFGYSEEELLGASVTKIAGFSKKMIEDLTEDPNLLAASPEQNILSRRINGDPIWFSVKKVPIKIKDENFIILYCQDVSEQKLTEKTLRESQAQIKAASQIAKLGYWEYEYSGDKLRVSDQFFSIFKTSVEEIGSYEISLEKYTELFLPPEEMEMIAREIELGTKKPVSKYHRYLEHQAKYADGTPAWMGVHFIMLKDDDGIGFKTIGVTQDITERKQTELTIREHEISLEKAFEIAAMGTCNYNFKLDEVYWSPLALNVVGITREEAPKNFKEFQSLFHPEDLPQLMETYEKADSIQTADLEIRMIIHGEIKWLRLTAKLEEDKEGRLHQSIGIIQDITERKLAEQELQQHRGHLERLVKERTRQLESINEDLEAFAYSISHDLRAPIRHINGYTSLLKKEWKRSSEEREKYLNLIIAASRRMGEMIDALLNFSKLGRQELIKAAVDLNELVAEVIQNFELDFRHRSLEWKVSRLPMVSGDRGLLKIVFENLLSNAIKYTAHKKNSTIEIGSQQDPSQQHIFIRDNGVGFDMTYVDKLFGVFQRLHKDEDFEGTGIGLANVQQIIKKHGWSIRAESGIDEGATFYIQL